MRIIGVILSLLLFGYACKESTPSGEITKVESKEKKQVSTPLERGNQKMILLEAEEIELFIQRYGWDMIKTGTGLRYQVTKKGSGETIQEGDEVSLEYHSMLLNGDSLYSSKQDGPIIFKVNKSDAVTGLHEAMTYLGYGDQVRLIVPSYLAYGIAGDGYKVTGQQSIVYFITVNKNKSNNLN